MRELGGTMAGAGSCMRDTAIAGHRLPVILVRMFSTKSLGFSSNSFKGKFVTFRSIESGSLHHLNIKLILETISQAEVNYKNKTMLRPR